MKGLLVTLAGVGGSRIHLDSAVEGRDSHIQNALVTVGTFLGSDPIFPDRGTELLDAAVRGALIDQASRRHYCNFAALDVLFFTRANDEQAAPRVQVLEIIPESFDGKQMTAQSRFTFDDGVVVGQTLNI